MKLVSYLPAGCNAAGPASVQAIELETYGKRLAEVNCSRCHAIGKEGESAHTEAPAFRDLAGRYPINALEEALAEGIYVGHPDMPEFQATPEQIDALLAYIESVW